MADLVSVLLKCAEIKSALEAPATNRRSCDRFRGRVGGFEANLRARDRSGKKPSAAEQRTLRAAHAMLTEAHALPSSVLLKVATPSHASHTRSAVAEPAVFWPWPAGHVAQAEHAPLPAAVLKWPAAHASLPAVVLNICSGHSEHTRSDVVVGSAVEYSPAEQVFTVWHTRSDVVVGAVNVN